ncbi:ABC transporter substrate-binding protein [Paenisporosarcina sp.]|uniref:ABC transporter substrate-binding protein n=1 Tax=Paenisporosarcina sp. TaxID=1932001 RepID=UPI003C760204
MEIFINFTQPIKNLLPTYCVGTNEVNISRVLFRSLYEFEHNIIKYDLVQSDYHNEDYTSWIIKIFPFQWSDGSEGTIQDVVNTWSYIIKNNLFHSSYLLSIVGSTNYKKGILPDISGLQIRDKYTVKIDLKNPIPYFREILSNINFAPVKMNEQNEIFHYNREDFNSHIPFITNKDTFIDKWTNREIAIESKKKRNGFNKYNFTFTNNYDEIHDRFISNKLHIHDGGTIDDNDTSVLLNKYMKYYDFLSTYYLFYNTSNEKDLPLDLRKKMNFVVHENKNLINSKDKVQTDRLVPLSLRSWQKSKKDVFHKKDEMKYIQERELVFICNDETAYINLSKELIGLWKKQLDLNIKLEVLTWEDFIEALTKGDFDIARAGWVADFAHPHSFYEVLTSTSSSNFAKWNNSTFDTIFNQSGGEKNFIARNNYFEKMDFLIEDEVPILPIYEHKLRQLVNTNVDCFDISHTGIINFNSTTLKL